VIDAVHGRIENNHQLAIIDTVEGNSSVVVFALKNDQSMIPSTKTEETGAQDQCKVLVSFPMITISTVDKVVGNSISGVNDVKHQTMIKVEPQCPTSPSSFLKPGCIETHL